MKTLLLKEHIVLKRSYYYILVATMFFIPMLTAFNYELDYFGIMFPLSILNIIAFETINQDDRTGWSGFQDIIPIRKQDVVAEKFLMSIIMFAVMLISFGGASVIRYFMNIYQEYEFITSVTAIAVVICANGIGFLMYYGFGMKKQLNVFSTAFAIGAVLSLLNFAGETVGDGFGFGFCGVVLLVCFAIFGICYILTVKRYEKNGVKI